MVTTGDESAVGSTDVTDDAGNGLGSMSISIEAPMPRPHPASELPEPLRIAVLAGGANTERNVSLSTGTAVTRALRGLGHAVAQLDSASSPVIRGQDPTDEFLTAEVDPEDLPDTPDAPTATAPPDLEALAAIRARQRDGVLADGLLPILQAADLAFICVFGDEGESGATQRLLEAHGIIYTGPSSDVCALTYDKAATKRVLRAHDIHTPRWHVVRAIDPATDLEGLTIPGPWIVKPIAGGSTIGMSQVTRADELPAACARASAAGADALIEEFVAGRDFTVGALGERVFTIVETLTDRPLYDYEAKYTPGLSRKRVPADLTEEEAARLVALTADVHRVLEIGDTSSRTDFRLTEDGEFTCFETNPLPGLTPTSSYPLSAAGQEITFPQLCEELVVCALRRAGRMRR